MKVLICIVSGYTQVLHIYSFLEEFRVLLCMMQSGHEEGAGVFCFADVDIADVA